MTDNNKLFKEKVNRMGMTEIKLPSIKQFAEERLKLKEFLIQMHFKIIQKGVKLPISMD